MAPSRFDGQRDLARAADSLATRLPEPLAGLARLAYNYRWSWQADGDWLFRSIDPRRWQRVGTNPVRLLQEVSGEVLARAAQDRSFVERVEAAVGALADELAYQPATEASEHAGPRAFFCAEFAVHASLPIYSGGLGALAGDFLKQASDDAMPLVGVGLLYRQGYFRQRVDGNGLQHEYWVDSDPERLPAALVTGADGAPVTVAVPIAGESVRAQIWRVDVGRVPLFLLDTDLPENTPHGTLDRLAAIRRGAGAAARPVPAARRRRGAGAGGDGPRARLVAPERGPRRLRLDRARRARACGRQAALSGRSSLFAHGSRSRRTRQFLPATTATRSSRSWPRQALLRRRLGSGPMRSRGSAAPTPRSRLSRSGSRSSHFAPRRRQTR